MAIQVAKLPWLRGVYLSDGAGRAVSDFSPSVYPHPTPPLSG